MKARRAYSPDLQVNAAKHDTPKDIQMPNIGQDNLPISEEVEATPGRAIDPALRRLIDDKRDAIRDDVSRNGHLSVARKAEQRADYAKMIRDTEGREVREYKKASPERRKAQKKASRDKLTTAEQSAARKARRDAAKQRKQEEAAHRSTASNPDFGRF